MARVLGVFESLDADRRIPLGHLWGVRLTATPEVWRSPVALASLGWLLSLATGGQLLGGGRLGRWIGLSAGGLVVAGEVTKLTHSLGHLIGARLVGGPMDELLLTGTRQVTLYRDDGRQLPRRVHVGRALGGPVANLAMAVLLLMLLGLIGHRAGRLGPPLRLLAAANMLAGLGALLPVPDVDGAVIWGRPETDC